MSEREEFKGNEDDTRKLDREVRPDCLPCDGRGYRKAMAHESTSIFKDFDGAMLKAINCAKSGGTGKGRTFRAHE